MILVVMYFVYSATAYPFGVAADHFDRRLQLGIGALVLAGADLLLAYASDVWLTVLGAALWGLHLGLTQGPLGAIVADAAPDELRGTAFGIYDVSVGSASFAAGTAAGVLWMLSGPQAAFLAGACISGAAALLLLFRAPRSFRGTS
jgi:MFS family permease